MYARERNGEKQFSIKGLLLLYLVRNGPPVLEAVLAPGTSQLSKRHRLGGFPFSTIKFRRVSKIILYQQGLSASKPDAICCLKQSAFFQDSATVMFLQQPLLVMKTFLLPASSCGFKTACFLMKYPAVRSVPVRTIITVFVR